MAMKTEPGWTYAAEESAVTTDFANTVYPKGVSILLIKTEGELFALGNRCVHMACPLAAGRLDGAILTCGCHEWSYDIRSGCFLDAPEIKLDRYASKIEDGQVFVRL